MKIGLRRKPNGTSASEKKVAAQEQATERAVERAQEALRRAELLHAEVPPRRDPPP